MFRITPKPDTLHYRTELDGVSAETSKPPRRISFTADVNSPTSIHLSSGERLNLTGNAELTPVWVTISEAATPPEHDGVDGSRSWIGLLEESVSIHISLEPVQFEETLRAFRERHRVTFDLGPRLEDYLPYNGKPPPTIDWEGRGITWRDEQKKVIAIGDITILTAMPRSDEPTETLVDEEQPVHRSDLIGASEALTQSIVRIEHAIATTHRVMTARLLWIIVLLGVVAAAVLFRW